MTARVAAAPQMEAGMVAVPESSFAFLPVESIEPSRTNPRGKLDKAALEELTESVRRQGVLMPVLVRPLPAAKGPGLYPARYELVAGNRRLTAAKTVGLATVPATIRELTETEALELQLLENLQRADLTPLEEAEGYRRLMASGGYDAVRLAERVGRSVKYVHDRVKLLSLTKDARALLIEERITAGHAILLARLKPADQARAMSEHALFTRQQLMFADDDEQPDESPLKPVSVREFNDWIDKNVRFDAQQADPVLFPEAALAVREEPRVVAITHLHYIPEEARDGKTVGPRSWKRADGLEKSKVCAYAKPGLIVVGPHRGDVLDVCTAKDKCATHWGSEIRERKRAAEQRASAPVAPAKPQEPSPADRAFAAAVEASREKAVGEVSVAVLKAAAAMSPEAFVRAMAQVHENELRDYLSMAGEAQHSGRPALRSWISTAPIAQVQRALAYCAHEYFEPTGAAAAFGVDKKAIFAAAEKAARAAAKTQASAAAKAGKPKAAKRGKAAAAPADED